jgi:hypothetical protein
MRRPLPLVEDVAEISCPKRLWATIARDACLAEQTRCGPACNIGCESGPAAARARAAYEIQEEREEQIRAAVRELHAAYYRKWKLSRNRQLSRRVGRPGGRPRQKRAPIPGTE